jgi:hypothetical protein
MANVVPVALWAHIRSYRRFPQNPQRAASASYRRGQITDAVRNAAVGLVVTATGHGRNLTAILGAGWFAVSFLLLRKMMSSTAKQGRPTQEQLDTGPIPAAVAPSRGRRPNRRPRRRPARPKASCRRRTRPAHHDGWYDPTTGVHVPPTTS